MPPIRATYTPGVPVESFARNYTMPIGQPVLVVIGSAAEITQLETEQLGALIRDVVVPIAEEYGVTIVDGGTDAGVMRLLGDAHAELRGSRCKLVGVAPRGKVEPSDACDAVAAEPNHTWLVLAPGAEWSSELTLLADLSERLAGDARPVVLVLGGGKGTRKEFELAVRRRWPVLLVSGTGRLADELGVDPSVKAEQTVKTIEADPACDAHGIASGEYDLGRQLRWLLSPDDLLRRVWLGVKNLDEQANRAQPSRYWGLRSIVLMIGVLIVILSLVASQLKPNTPLTVMLAVLPVIAASMMAWLARRGRDQRWVALRAGANSLVHQIFLYRANAGVYVAPLRVKAQPEPPDILSQAWHAVAEQLARLASFSFGDAVICPTFCPSFGGPTDESDEILGDISGSAYLRVRVHYQSKYFKGKLAKDDRVLRGSLVIIYGAAVVGTLIAALSGEFTYPPLIAYVAATAAVATAAAAWLEYDQAETRLQQMSGVCAGLELIVGQWLALSREERARPDFVSRFVRDCEQVLLEENREWERAISRAQRAAISGS